MSDQVRELLRRGAVSTPLHVDVESLVTRGRQRQRRRRHATAAIGALIAVGVIAGSIVLLGLLSRSDDPSIQVTEEGEIPADDVERLELSIFESSPVDLPWPMSMSADSPADLSTFRLALQSPDGQVYVGRGKAEGTICLAVRSGEGGGGMSCGSEEDLAERGAIALRTGDATTVLVAGVVADEVVSVDVAGERATIGENAFLAIATWHSVDVLVRTPGATWSITLPDASGSAESPLESFENLSVAGSIPARPTAHDPRR